MQIPNFDITFVTQNQSPGGEIGRRARFRCVCRKTCRFDSCPGHRKPSLEYLTRVLLFRESEHPFLSSEQIRQSNRLRPFCGQTPFTPYPSLKSSSDTANRHVCPPYSVSPHKFPFSCRAKQIVADLHCTKKERPERPLP